MMSNQLLYLDCVLQLMIDFTSHMLCAFVDVQIMLKLESQIQITCIIGHHILRLNVTGHLFGESFGCCDVAHHLDHMFFSLAREALILVNFSLLNGSNYF